MSIQEKSQKAADLVIKTFSQHYANLDLCFFVSRLRDKGLDNISIATVLLELDCICLECFNSGRLIDGEMQTECDCHLK